MTREKLKKIKLAAGCCVLVLMAAFLIYANISEIKKGNATNRTVAGSTYRDLTYFSDFTLKTFDGDDFSNSEFEGYDVIVVNVWEPWCTSCLKEMPELNELAEEYREKGLLLIEVQGTAFTEPDDVQLGYESVEPLNITMPMLLADERFSEEVLPYINNAFPGTWVLDSEGNVLDYAASAKSKDAWAAYFDGFLD